MSRIVKVLTPKSDRLKEISTSATTWEQLQADMARNGIEVSGLKGVVKETKNTLETAGATLPDGSFTLYLFPNKVKSGLPFDYNEMLEDLKTQLNEAIDEIIERIDDGDYGTPECEVCDERDALASELGVEEQD